MSQTLAEGQAWRVPLLQQQMRTAIRVEQEACSRSRVLYTSSLQRRTAWACGFLLCSTTEAPHTCWKAFSRQACQDSVVGSSPARLRGTTLRDLQAPGSTSISRMPCAGTMPCRPRHAMHHTEVSNQWDRIRDQYSTCAAACKPIRCRSLPMWLPHGQITPLVGAFGLSLQQWCLQQRWRTHQHTSRLVTSTVSCPCSQMPLSFTGRPLQPACQIFFSANQAAGKIEGQLQATSLGNEISRRISAMPSLHSTALQEAQEPKHAQACCPERCMAAQR